MSRAVSWAVRRPRPRRLAGALLGAALLAGVVAGPAGAQINVTRLSLAGQSAQSIQLYGAEYASDATLRRLLTITPVGRVIRVTGLGHTLLLPLDEDQQRATTDFNTVQLDTERVQSRTATLVNGTLYLPLDTLARGLGATYEAGKFSVPEPKLLGVSSRAGRDTDRLVLDLSRDVELQDALRGNAVVVTLRGLKGEARRYTTRGAFLPSAEVKVAGADLTLTFPLPAASGYRVYKVVRAGATRVVVDAGPGVLRNAPALLERLSRPNIVLDPGEAPAGGRDPTLEVALRAAELLSAAGWQVQVTRTAGQAMDREQALGLIRQSDVYLALSLGRFPGSARGGVTVYEQTGEASSQLINALRSGTGPALAPLVVAGSGSTRRLGELLRGELRGGGVTARQQTITKVLTLGEAPQAALLLELGWAGNAGDLANLAVEARLRVMGDSVARSVATYLSARAANNAALLGRLGDGAAGETP